MDVNTRREVFFAETRRLSAERWGGDVGYSDAVQQARFFADRAKQWRAIEQAATLAEVQADAQYAAVREAMSAAMQPVVERLDTIIRLLNTREPCA